MILSITLLVGLTFFGAALVVFKRFDAMVHRIYDSDRERWQKLGGPTGYFWHPNEKMPFFRCTHARDALLFDFICAGLKEPPATPTSRGGSA